MGNHFEPHAYAKHIAREGFASDGQQLFRWTGTHWCALHPRDGERHAYGWIAHKYKGHACARNANSAHRAAVLHCELITPPTTQTVIPCRNGYVWVERGDVSLSSADRTLGIRHVLGCDYEPASGSAKRFHAFLDRVLPEPAVQARVQEYVGYTLTADARYQRAQFWLGAGANGKGVLANIVQELHAKCAAVQLNALNGFRLSPLIDASLIFCDEAPRGRFDEQLIKSMIAGETVQIDRKYRDPLSVKILAKWLVLGNHLPAITDHSVGFWRRWDVVPFSETVPESERDPTLARSIIDAELPGVLNWALDGLLRLRARGAFDTILPKAMRLVLHEAKSGSNSAQAWADECSIGFGTACSATKQGVYDNYREWCSANGLSAVSSPLFWKRLRDIGPVEESRNRHDGVQTRMCNVLLPAVAHP